MTPVTVEWLEDFGKRVYQTNVECGWWDDVGDRRMIRAANLIASEISEMNEAYRKDKMDDHLPHRSGVEVEMADILIRALDFLYWTDFGVFNGKIEHILKPYNLDIMSQDDFDLLVSDLHEYSVNITRFIRCSGLVPNKVSASTTVIDQLVLLCYHIANNANLHKLDLVGAAEEKLAYNKQRADHKRENRAKAGGKKF